MKKLVCMLMSLMATVTLFVGCGGGGGTITDPQPATDESGNVAEQEITITIGLPQSVNVVDYETNAFTLWLEEVTGYKIDIKKYSTDNYATQLATETAGEEKLPDIFYYFRIGDDLINRYGEDGYFIDLTEYYEDKEKSKVFWDSMEALTEDQQENLMRQLRTNDSFAADGTYEPGPIYCYPTVEISTIDSMDFQPMINKEWLQRLNLKVPTNPTELRDVLMAFKTQDANGNGDPNDEIPMLGGSGALGHQMIEWLINFFIYWDDSVYFNVDASGKLYSPVTHEKYREALKYINGLYEDGLMNPNTLTYGMKDLRNVIQSSDSVGVTCGHPTVQFVLNDGACYRWQALDLYGNIYLNEYPHWRDVFITDSCENPDAAWEVLMVMSSKEGYCRRYYGELGVDWKWSNDEQTEVLKINNYVGTPNNQTWSVNACGLMDWPSIKEDESLPTYDAIIFKNGIMQDILEDYLAAMEKQDTSMVCPPLTFNEEELDIAGDRESIKKEVKMWRSYFINGTKDIDSDADWQAYLDYMNTCGLNKWRDAAQQCYDRTYAGK